MTPEVNLRRFGVVALCGLLLAGCGDGVHGGRVLRHRTIHGQHYTTIQWTSLMSDGATTYDFTPRCADQHQRDDDMSAQQIRACEVRP